MIFYMFMIGKASYDIIFTLPHCPFGSASIFLTAKINCYDSTKIFDMFIIQQTSYDIIFTLCYCSFGSAFIFFNDSNQLPQIYSHFWYVHSPTKINWYNLHLVLLLNFLFLCIALHQNQWCRHRNFPYSR